MQKQKKNYSGNDVSKVTDGYASQSKILTSVFPSPAILESYAEVDPNIVPQLIEMVKKEQLHRHSLEKKHLKSQAYTTRIGQLLAFALVIIIIYTAVSFTAENSYIMAAITIIIGFSFVIAINFIPGIAQKINAKVVLKDKLKNVLIQGKKNFTHNKKNI